MQSTPIWAGNMITGSRGSTVTIPVTEKRVQSVNTSWNTQKDRLQWILIAKGESWGDIDSVSHETLEELNSRVKALRNWVKPKPKQAILKKSEQERSQPEIIIDPVCPEPTCNEAPIPANIIESIDDDERPPAIWRPQEHGYCLNCEFQVHPNPPPHFTPEMRKYCCGWCMTTKGQGHGGHCFRCI